MKIKFTSIESEQEVTVEGKTLFACLAKIEEHFGMEGDSAFTTDPVLVNEMAEVAEKMEELDTVYQRRDFSDSEANFDLVRVG